MTQSLSIKELFNKAIEDVHKLTSKPSNDELLNLYANYKQGTVGDVNKPQPSFYMLKEISKWNAWNNLKGVKKIQAQVNYIKLVENLKKRYN